MSEDEATAAPIYEFDLRQLKPNPFIVVAGQRGSGKTHTALWIHYLLAPQFDQTYVLSITGARGAWDNVVEDPSHLYRTDFEEVLQLIVECQQAIQDSKGAHKMPRVCIVLDDVIPILSHESPALVSCATNGRNLNISVIMLTQYYYHFRPVMRTNTDLLLVFGNSTANVLDIVYDECASSAEISKPEFREIYRSVAQEHRALAILSSVRTQNVSDRFFWFEAPERLPVHERPKPPRVRKRGKRNECVTL